MLLPDNINPKLSIYYNSAILINILKNNNMIQIVNLYDEAKKENDISFSTFILCLDWLYLIESALILEDGRVKLCI